VPAEIITAFGRRTVKVVSPLDDARTALAEIAFAAGVNANVATTAGERSRWIKVHEKAKDAHQRTGGNQ
jgi:hypothetical protein